MSKASCLGPIFREIYKAKYRGTNFVSCAAHVLLTHFVLAILAKSESGNLSRTFLKVCRAAGRETGPSPGAPTSTAACSRSIMHHFTDAVPTHPTVWCQSTVLPKKILLRVVSMDRCRAWGFADSEAVMPPSHQSFSRSSAPVLFPYKRPAQRILLVVVAVFCFRGTHA